MTQLAGAVVLLTGATGGFGRILTREFLQAGSHLILNDRDPEHLEQLMAEWAEQTVPGQIVGAIAADLATSTGCQSLYDQVQALTATTQAPVDILINNAGIALFGRTDEIPAAAWETLLAVNFLAPVRLSSWFAADMVARRSGHIVNISSLAGWIAPPGLVHYGASKFGLRGFTEGLADELRPYQVQVMGVYPFFSRTPLLKAQRYGSLATEMGAYPPNLATNPATVMRAVVRGIQRNKRQVFPDPIALLLHYAQRFVPGLLRLLRDSFGDKLMQLAQGQTRIAKADAPNSDL